MQETNLKGLTFYDKVFRHIPYRIVTAGKCFKNKLSIVTYKLYNAF